MIKKNLFLPFLFCVLFSLNSCRDTVEKETIVREVEVPADEPDIEVQVTKEEEDEGILERTAKEVDEEVNEEINQEIENIGDDN
ncbi:MAG TPA: hypothetical protein VFM59_08090 [Salinimicrobium sp.]|nr:hypothetical protein [Salinimicrobium sp.]